jgi:hypothetical protein
MRHVGGDSVTGLLVVGAGDCTHTVEKSDTLLAYARGLCIAVGIWIRFPMDKGRLFVGLRLESSQ